MNRTTIAIGLLAVLLAPTAAAQVGGVAVQSDIIDEIIEILEECLGDGPDNETMIPGVYTSAGGSEYGVGYRTAFATGTDSSTGVTVRPARCIAAVL